MKPARKYFDPAQNAWPLFAVEQFGLAIDYALGQWRTLAVYLKDGQVEIDNNLVENAIRPTAIGKKNWLFIGDAAAGERSAIIYTVIKSCRRRSLDPYAYMAEAICAISNINKTTKIDFVVFTVFGMDFEFGLAASTPDQLE